MHNWILFCYKEKQNNERRLVNPEITEGRRTDLDALHWVGNQDSLTKTTIISPINILAFNAYVCVHKQRWAWV